MPPVLGRRNNDLLFAPQAEPPVPAATAAPTNENALNSPLEDEVTCNKGAEDAPDEEAEDPVGENFNSGNSIFFMSLSLSWLGPGILIL
jgi:hypothetical protein